MGDDDWRAIEISPEGWRVLQPPTKFRRGPGMAAFPLPTRDGSLGNLVEFLNVAPASLQLLLTWLTFSFVPERPYPVIALSGPQGAAKSSFSKIIRQLSDPADAEITVKPRSRRDLMFAAKNSHLMILDNLSELPDEMSDLLCSMSTGGAHREREYYTNDGREQIFNFRCATIVNGVAELPQRPDLLDRSILARMDAISDKNRQDEETFWQRFESLRPGILGAVLDVVSAGLRRLPAVRLTTMPRMADFARWGCAVEEVLGYKAGSFTAALRRNAEEIHLLSVEASPIAIVLTEFIDRVGEFSGTALELLKAVNDIQSDLADTARRHPRWPKSASQLSGELGRIETNLARLGVSVKRGRTHSGRFVRLSRVPASGAASDRDDTTKDAKTKGVADSVTA